MVYSDKLFGKCKAIFDTGAEFPIADESILKHLGVTRNMLTKPCMEQACAVNGHSLYNIGILKVQVRFGGNEVEDDVMIVRVNLGQTPLLLNWRVSCLLRNDLEFPDPLGSGSITPHLVDTTSVSLDLTDSTVHDTVLPKEFLAELGYTLL